MKKSFLIGLVAMLMMGLILVACVSYPPPRSVQQSSRPAPKWAGIVLTGENEPLLEGTTWTYSYTASNSGSTTVLTTTYEFRAGGRMVWRNKITSSGGYYNESTGSDMIWQRDGNNIRIIGSGGTVLLEGTYYSATQRIMLTGETSEEKWDVTWELLQGSSIATPTSPSSTTNVYVQPSAPAQSPAPAPAPAPSTPTFQPGRYAFSGSNITMSLTGYQATAYSGYEQVAWGTYRINGNQLVITFHTGVGVGASLQGKTFAYTITSNTSFSGSGETWVRTGY
jgi:hypothetical protein